MPDSKAPLAATGDLPPEQLVDAGRTLLDWIAEYLARPERHPVLSRARPGDVRRALPESPPVYPEPLDRILADFERVIVPGITHWNHPGFFAYFAISAPVPGILGELLTAALNVNGMLWKTSPAATELELLTLDWLRQLMGMEPGWFGMICDTASMSTMLALAAARERTGLDVRERGLAGLPAMRVYASDQAHSSVEKGAMALGLGRANVVKIPSDDAFRMRPEALATAVAGDRARGMLPIAAVATVGTTSTTSVDPVRAIGEICQREGVWLHVDAAYGGAAAIVPEMRHVLDGVELADSLVVNPHKWLFTPTDCSALFLKDPAALKGAFELVPEYLRTRDEGRGTRDEGPSGMASDAAPLAPRPSPLAPDLMDYGVQLGRRFRALKLWMVIRAFGSEGLASRLRAHCALAREFASWVEREEDWQLVAPVPFSTVCFRYAPAGVDDATLDAINEATMHQVNASGEAYLSHTRVNGRFVLRLAIGNIRTERRHVERAWELLKELR
jgi:aromatic-L-amino-acid decarboxylase